MRAGHVTLTPEIARLAGEDAANRRMRREGRTTWNEDDWNEACRVVEQLLATIEEGE